MPRQIVDAAGSHRRIAFVALGKDRKWPWKRGPVAMLALLALVSIPLITSIWAIFHFEQRLDARARADLDSSGIAVDSLNLDWDYRNVVITGELPAGVSAQNIIDILSATDGRGIRKISVLAATAEFDTAPVTETGSVDVSVMLLDGTINLSGTVLSARQAMRLRQAASTAVGLPNVKDQLQVSGLVEAIPGSDQRIDSLANAIAGLDNALEADAGLSATDFRFNATVADENQVVDLLRRRGGAGDLGLVISGDIIAKKSAPGGVVEVDAVLQNGNIALTGVVLTEQQKEWLVNSANAAVGAENVTDELIATGAVEEMQQAEQRLQVLTEAIASFKTVIEADASLTVNEFVLNALLEYEEDTVALNAVRQKAEALGLEVQGVVDAKQISLQREVALLQQEIDLLSDEIRETVVFDSAGSQLGFDAKQTLDKVVDAMNRYQRPVVEVKGHTDNTGTTEANVELSLERAEFVREYLEISGIERVRLRSLGLGESSQIASNDTEFGKKQNRRVEFRVRGAFDY